MSSENFPKLDGFFPGAGVPLEREEPLPEPQGLVLAEIVPEEGDEDDEPERAPRRRGRIAAILFVATCASTFWVGGIVWDLEGNVDFDWRMGLAYSTCLMTILVCHEAGHYLQMRRYGVRSTFPFFIPMPIPPIGTMGALIVMGSRIRDRRALFDIGISGPLAGLVPTLVFSFWGLYYGSKGHPVDLNPMWQFGKPLIFKAMEWLVHGSVPAGPDIYLGPMAQAGWVGLLITSINLFPIGQLDGGHVLYGLLLGKARFVAWVVLIAAVLGVFVSVAFLGNMDMAGWTVMLALLFLMGPRHPPTGNDHMPLGTFRTVLGWLTLAFLIVGFTPNPFPRG